MKRVALIGTAALAFSFAFALPAFAQEAGHEDAKPAESKPAESKPAEAKPAPKPAAKQHAAPKTQEQKPQEAKPEGGAKPEEHPEHAENKPAPKPQPKPSTTHSDAAHNDAAHRDAAHNNDATHREATRTPTHTTTTKTTTTSAHRIPDDKYRANFGREHTFHVGHPEVVSGRSRFSYGGYAFYYAEPWPSGWGYDDDVYVVDIDGTYYLMNAAHPGVQLALVIDL
jgi:hypothetical protein